MANLKALYVFVSSTTGITYILNLETGPLKQQKSMDHPNEKGYGVVSGSISVVETSGTSTKYNVPAEGLYGANALWPNASLNCSGIDRIFVNFTTQSNNTSISAITTNSIQIVGCPTGSDSATLVHSTYPPK